MWMPRRNPFDGKLTLLQVMAWCRQAYGMPRQHWDNLIMCPYKNSLSVHASMNCFLKLETAKTMNVILAISVGLVYTAIWNQALTDYSRIYALEPFLSTDKHMQSKFRIPLFSCLLEESQWLPLPILFYWHRALYSLQLICRLHIARLGRDHLRVPDLQLLGKAW